MPQYQLMIVHRPVITCILLLLLISTDYMIMIIFSSVRDIIPTVVHKLSEFQDVLKETAEAFSTEAFEDTQAQ